MIPIDRQPQVSPSVLNWQDKSPCYKKDLVIKCVAIAAISIFSIALISSVVAFTAIPLAIKALVGLSIAAFTFAAVMKVHQLLHPYFFKKYDNGNIAKKVCEEIKETLPAAGDLLKQLRDKPYKATEIASYRNYVKKCIKEWSRYGYIKPSDGEMLINIYDVQVSIIKKMQKEEYPLIDQAEKLSAELSQTRRAWYELIESNVIPNLPFQPQA